MNTHTKVEITAHAAAAAYRMMDEDELAELAASIKDGGLLDPIRIGIIGEDRWIVDGRNRLKACEIAGVAPKFREIRFEDDYALRIYIVDCNERRSVTPGQKAMATAMIYPEPQKGGRGMKVLQKGQSLGVESEGYAAKLVSRARAVLAHSRTLAEGVRDGAMPLAEAFAMVEEARKALDADEGFRRRLAKQAPDLLAMVAESVMTVREAIAALDARVERAMSLKRIATGNLMAVVRVLDPANELPASAATAKFGDVDLRFWSSDAPPLDVDTIQGCIDVLSAYRDMLRGDPRPAEPAPTPRKSNA